jgi:microcystin-dependent protein
VPKGWLVCDGSEYPAADYPTLADTLSRIWGAPTREGHFVVPDLRGLFLRGMDEGKNVDPSGAQRGLGSVQSDDLAAHSHSASVSDPGHTHTYNEQAQGGPNEFDAGGRRGVNGFPKRTTEPARTGITVTIGSTGGGETRPKNAAVYYIIRAR